MPAKTKERAREIAKLWYSKNKKKFYEYYKITRAARRAHPEKQKCSMSGCKTDGERHHEDYSKPTEIVWLCRKHHGVSHRKYCSVCGEVATAKGLCNKHYCAQRRLDNKKRPTHE